MKPVRPRAQPRPHPFDGGAREDDPGVPEAEHRALGELLALVSAGRVDGLWRFPPLRKGRRESGLLAAGLFAEDDAPPDAADADAASAPDPDRRILVTLAWRAEETGKGITFESRFEEQGEAPRDRLPRVMTGVTRRMDEAAGEPRYLSVGGDPALLEALREELEP